MCQAITSSLIRTVVSMDVHDLSVICICIPFSHRCTTLGLLACSMVSMVVEDLHFDDQDDTFSHLHQILLF
jgi:hypothetical protein